MLTPEQEACSELWLAALRLLIEDAYRAAHRGHKAGAEAIAALDDVLMCGPMLQRLCRPIGIDPTDVSRAVLAEIERKIAA